MGREEERKKAKDWYKKKPSLQEKTRIYGQMKREVQAQVRDEAVVRSLEIFTSAAIVALHDKFGFGEMRLQRFIHEASEQMECIFADTIRAKEMVVLARELSNLPLDWREEWLEKGVRHE